MASPDVAETDRLAAGVGEVRLRTPTSLLRWTLYLVGPTLLAITVVMSVLSGAARTVVMGGVLAVAGILAVRVARIEARVTPEGVLVRNPFRTHAVRWDQVARADWIARGALGEGLRTWGLDARVRLSLRDGRFLTMTSTYSFKPSTADHVTDVLRRTATPTGVAVEPLYRDGPARPTG